MHTIDIQLDEKTTYEVLTTLQHLHPEVITEMRHYWCHQPGTRLSALLTVQIETPSAPKQDNGS